MRNAVGCRRAVLGAVALAMGLVPATAAAAADTCANAAFRPDPLPDCRALEQVTPVDKGGSSAVQGRQVLPGPDGSVQFFANGAVADNGAAPYLSSFLGVRSASGWTTRGIDVAQSGIDLVLGLPLLGVSTDQTKALVVSRSALTPGAIDGGSNLYLEDLREPGGLTLIAAKAGPRLFVSAPSLIQVTGTADFSTFILRSNYALEPGSSADFGPQRLYRWSAGTLTAITQLDTGSGNDAPNFDSAQRSVSTDGRRLTYAKNDGNVYQYEAGAERLITHLPGQPTQAGGGRTPIASEDGSSVTFASDTPLTAASSADRSSVYRWNAATGESRDLLAGMAGLPALTSALRVDEVSADGNLVWFSNLPDDGSAGDLLLLDVAANTVTSYRTLPSSAFVAQRFSPSRTAMALLVSDGCVNGVCTVQAYEFRPASQSVPLCATCGAQPQGSTTLGVPKGNGPDTVRTTSILDDGRMFFDATAQLDPRDGDGSQDVYEYTPGVGARLLSGQGGSPVRFGGASADGTDVYMITANPLVPADVDAASDVYDARVGGGLADQQVRPNDTRCQGEACRPAASPVVAPTPAPTGSAANVPVAPAGPPSFSVASPSKAALRKAARTGRLDLRVAVGASGTVSADLQGRIDGRTRTAAQRSVKASRASTVTVRLRLSKAARRTLRSRGSLSTRLTVAYSKRTERVRKTIKLVSTQKKGGRR